MTLPAFSFSTSADEVTFALAEEVAGKNVLITGTTIGGLGFEAARAIAKYANLVIITGHNLDRLRLSGEEIMKEFPAAKVRTLVLDLSSLAAVRKAAAEVNAYSEPLHVLIHNAASTSGVLQFTSDNLEMQMATAQFGPFLLTKLLFPKLLESSAPVFTPRVVFVSSSGHAAGPGIDFNHLRRPNPAVENNFILRYSEVKTANILMASELSRRARGKLHAYSVHPGSIFTSSAQKPMMSAALKTAGVLTEDGQPNHEMMQWKTVGQGAAPLLAAAFDPRINDKSGAYIVDCVESNKDVAPHASDPDNAEKLWRMTEEIVGETFVLE